MIRYENQPLQYLPQRDQPVADITAPMAAYNAHQKDLRAQEEAKQMMALRQREQGFREDQGGQDMGLRTRAEDRNERHMNARDSLANTEEGRRASSVVFDRKRLEHEDIEKWAHLMAYGATPAEREYAASMLKGMYNLDVEPIAPTAEPAAPGAPDAQPVTVKDPTLGGTLQADDAQPMGHAGAAQKPGDAALGRQLDGIDQTYSKGLGVAPGAGMPYKAALAQANATGSLGVKQVGPDQWVPIPKGEGEADSARDGTPKYLPGRSPMAKSDQFLSEGDPYNKL